MAAASRFRATLASPLPGVPAEAWERFAQELALMPDPRDPAKLVPRPMGAVSESGGLGAYDMRPRRLVELGLGRNLRSVHPKPGGARFHICDFVLPLTQDAYLGNPLTQYLALTRSMKRYHADLVSGALPRPEGVSLGGALAILHRGGRGALTAWPDLFPDTRALCERARGAF